MSPAELRIIFRIGINLGDVVVEGDDLLGDGVNVAARLEQLCEPGGVLISGTAFDQLQGKIDLPIDFAGEQHVKNLSRPVRTYRLRLDGASLAVLEITRAAPLRLTHRRCSPGATSRWSCLSLVCASQFHDPRGDCRIAIRQSQRRPVDREDCRRAHRGHHH